MDFHELKHPKSFRERYISASSFLVYNMEFFSNKCIVQEGVSLWWFRIAVMMNLVSFTYAHVTSTHRWNASKRDPLLTRYKCISMNTRLCMQFIFGSITFLIIYWTHWNTFKRTSCQYHAFPLFMWWRTFSNCNHVQINFTICFSVAVIRQFY